MADQTKLPSSLFYGQWARPDAENPRLLTGVSAVATTIVATNALLDEDGAAVTGNVMLGCKDANGFTESIWAGAATSTDGITFTGVVRGIDLSGLDNTTQNDSDLAVDHESGDPLFVQISGINFNLLMAAIQGTIGSGGENWKIGNATNNDITIYAYNGDANPPFWRYVAASNGWFFSNDGVSSTPFGTGAGVTGGDGITVTAGDIDVDLTDTTVFRTARNGNEARGVVTAVADGLVAVNFMPTNVQEADTFFGATDITGAEAETLTDDSLADSLHLHNEMDQFRLSAQEVYSVSDLQFTAAGGAEDNTETGSMRVVATAATNDVIGHLWLDTFTASTPTSVHDKNPAFYIPIWFTSQAAQDGFVGFVDQAFTGTSVENNAMTLEHFGFCIADDTVVASSSDGTTQETTAVTGITWSAENDLYATFDGTTALFYVNGTLKATHTTKVPDGDLDSFSAAIIPDATAAAKQIRVKKTGRIKFDNL